MRNDLSQDQDEQFERANEIAFRCIDRAVRALLSKGCQPYALANALLSHGATLLGTLDGKRNAAEFLENTAEALRELDDAAHVPAAQKH